MRLRVKEPFSCYSHLAGVLLGIPGLVWLILRADGDPWRTVGFTIYGMSVILLYSASSLYHGLPVSPRTEEWLRRFDHVAIYLLIAGSYTPMCLITLRGRFGWSLFAVVWAIAFAGMVLKLFFPFLPRVVTTALYLGMGWMGVVAIAPLVHAVPAGGIHWLLIGGVSYTVGAVIYAIGRPDPFPNVFGSHDIFHLFVLAGSVCHFVFVVGYV